MSEEEKTNSEVNEAPELVLTTKNPKKVEQGKRLAMISKEAKERKMRARLEKEMEDNKSWTRNIPTFIAVGSSFGFAFTLLLFYFRKPHVIEKVVVSEANEPKKSRKENKFEEL